MSDCEYCGTTLTEDGANATDGSHHYVAQCREYVHAALRSYKREAGALRAELAALRAACRDVCARDWSMRLTDGHAKAMASLRLLVPPMSPTEQITQPKPKGT